MRDLLESLAERRAELVARSARQRGEIADAVAGIKRVAAEPLVLGLGLAVALLGSSARVRTWFVRAWVVGSLLRRLLAR
ncbi:MAG: hypothetical protein OEV81_08795 [Betaproteobacteria bacterium]|nr:hypothetical protein [Betaproteobacteria bacterium]MDH5221644.1 hypothetical protein [Betaproteobacteria bacterium]MDH5349726.1 hypothetical protein [Betaproteobacteria bacterium]